MGNNYAMLEEITSQITLRKDVQWFLILIKKPLFVPPSRFRAEIQTECIIQTVLKVDSNLFKEVNPFNVFKIGVSV